MDNPELILQSLEHFPNLRDEDDYNIPVELEDYIHHVAKTGDPVFQWTLVKPLFREKIIKVITDFFESNPGEIPDYPNVTKFNYDTMKETLLERIDWFKGAPFTIQRISELLVNPTKEYNRVDKYMRALEKNIYVVSTREPGMPQPVEENNSSFEESFIINGNDFELKTDINEDNGTKEEDEAEEERNVLLMLKKCHSGDADDPNFNIEVDVTNTTADDVQEDLKLDSEDINVHDELPNPSETSTTNEVKCGKVRKHENDEDDQLDNDSKHFKVDDNADGHLKEQKDNTTVDNVNEDTLQEVDEVSLNVPNSESYDKIDMKNVEKENISYDKDKSKVDECISSNKEDVEKNNEQVLEGNIAHDAIPNTADTPVSQDDNKSTSNPSKEEKIDNDSNKDDKEIESNNLDADDSLPRDSETSIVQETCTESKGLPTTDDMNIEVMQESNLISQNEELTSSINNEEINMDSKVEDTMELEETVDNKIKTFDNSKSESSLDMSEGDSMMISQESDSSCEEITDKSIEKVDMAVSESSDMDLSESTDTK